MQTSKQKYFKDLGKAEEKIVTGLRKQNNEGVFIAKIDSVHAFLY